MAGTIRKGRRKSKRRMDRSVRKITRRSRKSGRRTRRKVRRSVRRYQVGGMEEFSTGMQQTKKLIENIQAEVKTSRLSSANHLHVCYKGSDKCDTIDIRGMSLSNFIGDIVFARCKIVGIRNTFAISFVDLVFNICNIVASAEAKRAAQRAAQQELIAGAETGAAAAAAEETGAAAEETGTDPAQLTELGPVAEKLMNKLCGIEFPSIFKLMFSHDTLKASLRRDNQARPGQPANSGTSQTFIKELGGIEMVLNQPLQNAFDIRTLSIPSIEERALELEQTVVDAVKGISQVDGDVESAVASELEGGVAAVGDNYGRLGQIGAAAGLAGLGTALAAFPPLAWASPICLAGATGAALKTYYSRKNVTSTLQNAQLSGGLINICLGEMYYTEEGGGPTEEGGGPTGMNFYEHCVKPRLVECIQDTSTIEPIKGEILEAIIAAGNQDFLEILDTFRYSKYEVSTPDGQPPKLYVNEITIKDKGPHKPPDVYHVGRRNMKGKADATHIIVNEGNIRETFKELKLKADHRFKVTVKFGDPRLIRGLDCLNFLEGGIATETDYLVYLAGKPDEPVFPDFNTVHDYMPLINSRSIVDYYRKNLGRHRRETFFKVVPINGKVRSSHRDYWRPDMCGYGEFKFAVPNTCITDDFMNVKSLKRRIQYEIYSRLHENNVRFRLGVVGYSHLTPYQDGYGRVKDIGGVKAMIEDNSHPLLDHLDINDLGYVLSRLSIHTEEDAALSRDLPDEDVLENARDLMDVLEEVTETLVGRSFVTGSPLSMIEETCDYPGFMSINQIYGNIQKMVVTMTQPDPPPNFFETELKKIEHGLKVYETYTDKMIAPALADTGTDAGQEPELAQAATGTDAGQEPELQPEPELASADTGGPADAGSGTVKTEPLGALSLVHISVKIPEGLPKRKYRWYNVIYYTEDTGEGKFVPAETNTGVGASLSVQTMMATMPLHCFTKPFLIVMELVDTLREIYEKQQPKSTELLQVLQDPTNGIRVLSEMLEDARNTHRPRPYKECCTVCVPQSYRNPPPPYCSVSLPCIEKYELKFTGMFKAIVEPLTFGIYHSGYATSELGVNLFKVRNSIIQCALYDMTQLATKLSEIGRKSLLEGGVPMVAYDTFITKMLFSLSCVRTAGVKNPPERLAENIFKIRGILSTVKPQSLPTLEYWPPGDTERSVDPLRPEINTMIETGTVLESILDSSLADFSQIFSGDL